MVVHPSARRAFVAAVVLLTTVLAASAAADAATPAPRASDPVVLTGSQVPGLAAVDAAQVVAFSRSGAGWTQIPVQVDERRTIDLREAYPASWSCAGGQGGLCYAPASTKPTAVYADPDTLVGADPDPKVDGDDELVTIASDLGAHAAADVPYPAGTVAGSRLEAHPVTGTQGYVSFFATDGTLDPGMGRHDVDYTFDPLAGDFLTTYDFAGGANTEASTVVTSRYSRAFTDRWQESELRITTGGASGVDILDRNENQFAPDDCGRSSKTFANGEGTFLANREGPLRAIRSFMGANSGPMTQKTQVFYADREIDTVVLRVHPIPGIINFFDYSAAAAGMAYRNGLNPAGVTVDGVPDAPVLGPASWESVDGPQGHLTMYAALDSSVAPSQVTSFYRDELHPAKAPCQGDGGYYGASGLRITGAINQTDSTSPPARLSATRTMFFDAPGTPDPPADPGPPAYEDPFVKPVVTPPGPTPPTTPVARRPSNRIAVSVGKRQKRGTLRVVVTLPGPGAVKGTLKAGRTTVGIATLTAKRAGRRSLTVRVTRAGRKLAARHHGRLKVRLSIRFAPKGGTPRTITLKARTLRPGR